MLSRTDGSTFAAGRSTYLDADTSLPLEGARILVRLQFEGVSVLALLDTGAAWSIVDTEVADALGLFEEDGSQVTISSRVGRVTGKLVRVNATLVAEDGEGVELESTVFVSREWSHGSFVGYSGLLERIRFAIDPDSNSFFFGAL